MNISVTLLNRQLTSVDVLVDSVDTDAPKLVSTEARSDRIVFYLSDIGSGVDFENVTFSDPSGNVSPALGFDAAAGCVFLPYPDCPLNVRIPDLRGNVLQVDLKPQGQ